MSKPDPVIKKMLRRFNESSEAEADNRTRGLAAMKFRQGGQGQWEDSIYDLRGHNNQPRESYNQIPQFVHQVTNDMRMNMGEVKFIASKDGTTEIAKVYEDLVRNIQSSSEAEVAFDMAADSQVTIGWGYWRLITEYENDKSFDQIIKFMWVPNTFTVYDDPSCILQDRMDRKYLIQVSDIRLGDFNADRDTKDRYDGADLQSIGDGYPDWASDWDEGDDAFMRIAEYWEVKETPKTVYRTKDGKISDKKPKGEVKEDDKREVMQRKVIWRKCTGKEVLEEKEWPGQYIPYCFIAGEQINIDGKWYLSGLVEHMMSPQRQYNYWTNAATEAVSLIPNAPYMVDPLQIEGYEKWWDQANIKKYPYLPARRFIKGQDYGMPQRTNTGIDIGAMAQLIQNAQQNFYITTGIYPASLGKQGNEISGKAINARVKEGDISTFHFPDNMSRGQRACGRILEDLIKKIYDGARVIKLLSEDKTNASLPINQPITDPKTGQTLTIDLTLGTYDVAVTTGANFTTKRQEEQDALLQLAGSTNLMEVAPDIFYSKQDWSGADELAERYKKTLPPQLLGDDDGIPPQVKAALQQSQQMIGQLQQELQQAQQQLQSKQADIQLKAADLQLKQQDQQSSAVSDQMKAQNDNLKLQLDAQRNQLEQDKLILEREAMQLEYAKLQVGQIQSQSQPMGGDDMQFSKQALMAQLQALDEQEQQKQVEVQNQQVMQQQQSEKEAMTAQQSQMLIQNLVGIQQSLALLTQSIQAPKTVVRDPKTGLIAGVATVNG